jgi:small conductance mechanosensitive channel
MLSPNPQLPQTEPPLEPPALADSLNTSLDRIGEGVTATGRLILSGDWAAVWERTLEGATELAVSLVPELLSAIFVGLFFYAVYRILLGVVRSVLRRSDRLDRGVEDLLEKMFRLVAWAFIGLLVMSQLGVNVTALVAGLGIAGLAVGFAAQDSLQNFISGITIFLDRPFRIDDWVTVGDYYGRVTNITLRSTRLRTLNLETVIFPSVDMVTQPLVNHSAGGPLRVDVKFGIAYKESIDGARAAVRATVDTNDARLAEMDPKVVVTELNDSSVDMMLQLFVKDAGDANAIRFEYTERVRKALGEAGIEIPFPHLQLFVEDAGGPPEASADADAPDHG